MKKKKQNRKEKSLWVGAAVIIGLILFIAILSYFLSKPKYSTSEFLGVITKDKDVNEFANELQKKNMSSMNIITTKLTAQDIIIEQYGPYRKKYENLPLDREDIYKVDLITDKRDMIIIVDMESKKVLSSYGILKIRLGI